MGFITKASQILALASVSSAAYITSWPDTSGFTNATIANSRGGGAVCVSGYFPVSVSSPNNVNFSFPIPQNQTGATQFIISYLTDTAALLKSITVGPTDVSGIYQIAGSLCQAAGSKTGLDKVQILTHGGGFDRYYWDFAPGYSYVDIAVKAGYAVFLYDRLGVGESEKPDPVNTVQFPLEIQIIKALTQELRKGTFADTSYESVVGVGHSFGSVMTQGVTAIAPTAFNATILTGFTTASSGIEGFAASLNLAIAVENNATRFKGISPGYLVADSAISNQQAFFHYPGFDPELVTQAEAQKGLNAYGEFLTNTGSVIASNYTRPIAVVNGRQDLAFCNANCTTQTSDTLSALYPKGKNPTPYTVDNVGHGISLHYKATNAYNWIQGYLKNNGF